MDYKVGRLSRGIEDFFGGLEGWTEMRGRGFRGGGKEQGFFENFAHALCSSPDFKLPLVKNHIYPETMFEALTDRFSKIFSVLSKKKNLTEANIGEALGDIRRALLASDVAFEVVETFIDDIKRECVGQAVFKNVQPGQQVVKIVHDRLVDILGDERSTLNAQRPLNILLVGLQGSGKTTTAAKLALYLKKKNERPVLVACDIHYSRQSPFGIFLK